MQTVILFDFDGTLADSFESFLFIIDQLAIRYHYPRLSRAELESLRSLGARELIKKLQIPFYKLPFMARDVKRMQQNEIATIEPFKGLPEVLQTLKAFGYVLGIITSNGRANVETFVKKHQMSYFDYIFTDSSLFGKDKVLRKFLKKYSYTAGDVLYIGDEIRDIQACRKVGVAIGAVTWGFNTRAGLEQHKPDYLIDTPAELLQLLSAKRG